MSHPLSEIPERVDRPPQRTFRKDWVRHARLQETLGWSSYLQGGSTYVLPDFDQLFEDELERLIR